MKKILRIMNVFEDLNFLTRTFQKQWRQFAQRSFMVNTTRSIRKAIWKRSGKMEYLLFSLKIVLTGMSFHDVIANCLLVLSPFIMARQLELMKSPSEIRREKQLSFLSLLSALLWKEKTNATIMHLITIWTDSKPPKVILRAIISMRRRPPSAFTELSI